jgi:hypothetical protein
VAPLAARLLSAAEGSGLAVDSRTRVIIVNYNAGEALLRCVASVLAEKEPLQAVVADNDSTDGSCQLLRSRFASNPRLEVLENPVNLGFGRAVNACALAAREDWLLVLNPDCELHPGALGALRQALERDPAAGLAAPRVVDRQGRVLRGTLRSFPDPWKAFLSASGLAVLGRWSPRLEGVERRRDRTPVDTVRAEAVSGACMLIRGEVFRALGGFDEDFEMHFEDLDLMYRMRQRGWHCLYVPGATAFHEQGRSSRSRRWWVHRQKHLGMQRFFRKNGMAGRSALTRVFLTSGIWLHYLLTLPRVWLQR